MKVKYIVIKLVTEEQEEFDNKIEAEKAAKRIMRQGTAAMLKEIIYEE